MNPWRDTSSAQRAIDDRFGGEGVSGWTKPTASNPPSERAIIFPKTQRLIRFVGQKVWPLARPLRQVLRMLSVITTALVLKPSASAVARNVSCSATSSEIKARLAAWYWCRGHNTVGNVKPAIS